MEVENNIFQTGGVLNDANTIGYENYTKNLEYTIQQKLVGSGGIYVYGLCRIGKTSLVTNICSKISNKKALYVYLDVNLYNKKSEMDFCLLLRAIAKGTYKTLKKNIEKDCNVTEFVDIYNKLNALSSDTYDFRETFMELFEEVKELGYNVLLVLDEFDAAQEVFNNKADFEIFRSLTSNSSIYSLLLVTISRRPLYMIEVENPNNSTFRGVMQGFQIKGFSDKDIECFYQKLHIDYDIELSNEDKSVLYNYCGLSPYIWSNFGYEMVKLRNIKKDFDIVSIYRDNLASTISQYHEDILKCLKHEMDRNGSYYDKLIGAIVGPKIGVTKDNIEVLEQLGYLKKDDNEWCSISYAFKSFLIQKKLSASILDEISTLEKSIKLILEKEKTLLFSQGRSNDENNMWDDVLNNCYNGNFSNDTYRKFIKNNKKLFDVNSTVLDVMSLSDSFKIIENHWQNIFSKYFDNETLDKWENKFNLCGQARNPIHHVHEEYLTDSQRILVIAYCNEINKILSVAPKQLLLV